MTRAKLIEEQIADVNQTICALEKLMAGQVVSEGGQFNLNSMRKHLFFLHEDWYEASGNRRPSEFIRRQIEQVKRQTRSVEAMMRNDPEDAAGYNLHLVQARHAALEADLQEALRYERSEMGGEQDSKSIIRTVRNEEPKRVAIAKEEDAGVVVGATL